MPLITCYAKLNFYFFRLRSLCHATTRFPFVFVVAASCNELINRGLTERSRVQISPIDLTILWVICDPTDYNEYGAANIMGM